MLGNKKSILLVLISGSLLVLLSFVLYGQISKRDITDQAADNDPVKSRSTPVVDEGEDVDFPEDFPEYPNSTIEDKWIRDAENTTGMSFVLYTNDSKEAVYDHYINQVESSGWVILDSDVENYILNVQKDNKQGYLVLSDTEEGKTLISITFAEIKR